MVVMASATFKAEIALPGADQAYIARGILQVNLEIVTS